MKKLALIGAGALSDEFVPNLKKYLNEDYILTGVLARDFSKTEKFAKKHQIKPYATIEELLADQPDYAVEIAGVPAAKEYAFELLKNQIHFIPLSTGVFADRDFHKECEALAKKNNVHIYLPSGAIGGVDIMRAMTLMGDMDIHFEAQKPTENFTDLKEDQKNKKEIIFEGSAREAIQKFPKNVNITITAALASVGVEETDVKIIKNPELSENKYEILLNNPYVKTEVSIQSKANPENAASSSLAAWSVLALLDNLRQSIQLF